MKAPFAVIPEKVIGDPVGLNGDVWIPASAGMTGVTGNDELG
ncbi:MAG TPA: hypothetical protein VGB26_00320 [Nitrospiria bacterium]